MRVKIKHYWAEESFEVYNVRVFEDGDTCFLVYKDNEWQWVNADLCIPDDGIRKGRKVI